MRNTSHIEDWAQIDELGVDEMLLFIVEDPVANRRWKAAFREQKYRQRFGKDKEIGYHSHASKIYVIRSA